MVDTLLAVMERFSAFSVREGTRPDIRRLSYLDVEQGEVVPPTEGRLALVLVERRLVDAVDSEAGVLRARLARHKGDLRASGLFSRFVVADLYQGPEHRDGRTLLALRRFLVAARGVYPRLEGVTLVGRFPEAMLVRRVAWCQGGRLNVSAEVVSHRTDVVLADLTGRWEQVYREEPFVVEGVSGVPREPLSTWSEGEAVKDAVVHGDLTVTSSETFRDAFYVDDAMYSTRRRDDGSLEVTISRRERDPEVGAEDRSGRNVIARPDIAVSRINAYHVACNPSASTVGDDGAGMFDAAGTPRVVPARRALFAEADQHLIFSHHDRDLERQLLVELFDRNHLFRVGAFGSLPFRAASVTGAPEFTTAALEPLIRGAAADLGATMRADHADLEEYVDFLKTPAVLKWVHAHSGPTLSELRPGAAAVDVERAVGGPPPRWVHRRGRHVPSFEGATSTADLVVHRALWQHRTLAESGAWFMIHGGCETNSVLETRTMPYTAEQYGHWNNAESLLFFTPCLAIFARAKIFNDSPSGLLDGFRTSDRAHMGACWNSYFAAEANTPDVPNIQRKRAYFWSINGDWSLRLRSRGGLGVVADVGGRQQCVAATPARAWVDGWNFDPGLDRVRAIADLDGDGRDEIVVTSPWGIGLMSSSPTRWRLRAAAPRDTWLGDWRWDATVNTGRDQVLDAVDLTGSGRAQVLVSSSWGLGLLALRDGAFTSVTTVPRGGTSGGWRVGADDRYLGSGRFQEGAPRQIVVTSPWGLGLLGLLDHGSDVIVPSGTRLGDWAFDVARTRVVSVADLDGDGLDELLVASDWGWGVLKVVRGEVIAVAMHRFGDSTGDEPLRADLRVRLAARFGASTSAQVLAADSQGWRLLRARDGRFETTAHAGVGSRVDGWVVAESDVVHRGGDVRGDGTGEHVLRSAWGQAYLGTGPDGGFKVRSGVPHGERIGRWALRADDRVVGSGRFLERGRQFLLSGTSV